MEWLKSSKSMTILFLLIGLGIASFFALRKTRDDRFNNFDPLNPTTTADSMSSIYRQLQTLKKDSAICNKELDDVAARLSLLDSLPKPSAILKPDLPSVRNFLSAYDTKSIFSYAFQEGVTRPTYEDLYTGALSRYSDYLTVVLTQAQVPNAYSYAFNPFGVSGDSGGEIIQPAAQINTTALSKIPTVAKKTLSDLKSRLKTRISTDSATYRSSAVQFNYIRTNYFNGRFDIRGQAISWGIIAFVFTAIILYSIGAYFRDKRVSVAGSVNVTTNKIFLESLRDSTWMSVYMITVLLLIITIFVLGLAGLLKESTLAALLGSIAGYVLNGKSAGPATRTNGQGNGNPDNPNNDPNNDPDSGGISSKDTPNNGNQADPGLANANPSDNTGTNTPNEESQPPLAEQGDSKSNIENPLNDKDKAQE